MTANSLGFKWKTLGGKQFWTDVHHCGGWRVQENAVSGHFRLLDPQNYRLASGNSEDCRSELNRLIESGDVQPTAGRVVIVLHGLIRATDSMRQLGKYLAENSELNAVDFEYASTRRPVADHAKALATLIDSLGDQVTEINFVAHSLGNIVIRHYLADLKNEGRTEPRFKRMVMIGPPNQGSRIAHVLRRTFVFHLIAGSSGAELGHRWEELEPKLATPDFEFGIIAGGQTDRQRLSNFILAGKDDFTVSVEETKLAGATDFLVKPLLHPTMMRKTVTLEATLSFLENGYFESPESRTPLT